MSNGLRSSSDGKGRKRGAFSFSLSEVAIARVRFLAKQHGMTASAVVEMLIGGVDYPQMFALFEARAPLGKVVVMTGQPPALVQALFEEYVRGLPYERAATPVPALPPAPPRLVRPARKGA